MYPLTLSILTPSAAAAATDAFVGLGDMSSMMTKTKTAFGGANDAAALPYQIGVEEDSGLNPFNDSTTQQQQQSARGDSEPVPFRW